MVGLVRHYVLEVEADKLFVCTIVIRVTSSQSGGDVTVTLLLPVCIYMYLRPTDLHCLLCYPVA